MSSALRLSSLRDRHRDERCVILANGPSLNRFPLGFLRKEQVIGMNKIFLGLAKFRIYPRYYIAVNQHVIEQSANAIKQLHCVRFIDDRSRQAGILKEDALTHFMVEKTAIPFSKDLAAGYHQGHTVTYAALQVAYFLGYRQVVLLGLDHRYDYSGRPGAESVQSGPDRNHFSETYFAPGQKWENPDLRSAAKNFALARRVFEEAGGEILDATPEGACQVFKKTDYRKVFGL